MRRKVSGFVAGIGLVLAVAVGPVAAAQDSPGTPGDKNCEGQTTAYIAQVGKDFDAPGIGNVAAFLNLSVQDYKALIRAYCNP